VGRKGIWLIIGKGFEIQAITIPDSSGTKVASAFASNTKKQEATCL
jgi:hypothetical protein